MPADSPQLIDRILSHSDGDIDRAEAVLSLLEDERKQQCFVRYWEPAGDQIKFWDQRIYENKIWVATGTNRSGKTELGAWLCTVWLLGKDYFRGEPNWKWVEPLPVPDGPTSVRGVALKSDLLKDPMWEKLTGVTNHPPLFPVDGCIEKQLDREFYAKFTRGSKFSGLSADTGVDPKSHGGAACDLVWIDEECGHPYYYENFQRTVDKQGHLLITATPLDDPSISVRPWLFDLVQDAKEGRTEIGQTTGVINLSMFNNPHVSETERRLQVAMWTGHPEEGPRLRGEFARRAGLFYPNWQAKPPLWIPAYNLPAETFRVCIIDPASTGPVGVCWIGYSRTGKQTVYRTYKDKGKTASQHIEAILAHNHGDAINMWLMDPWRGRQRQEGDNKTILQVWRDAGLPRLQLADVDYDVCIEQSREYINAAFDTTHPHPAVEVFEICAEFKEEIERYVIDTTRQGPSRGEAKDRPRKGNDDVLNAWQFACGMNLRARPGYQAPAVAPGSHSYFGTPTDKPVVAPRPWVEEPW